MNTLYSMTGFASGAQETPEGNLLMELRSVNHRYLELQFRLPDVLRPCEPRLRELLSQSLKRGKVDCRLEWLPHPSKSQSLSPDIHTLEQLRIAAALIRKEFPDARPLSVADILNWPGVLPRSLERAPADEWLETLASTTLRSLSATRSREGQKLGRFLLDHAQAMSARIQPLRERMPALVSAYQEKLTQRLRESLASVDEDRLLQEVAQWSAKIDIAEELSRLDMHLEEVIRVVQAGGQSGKRLDFLMQELHREANTLGSKALHSELSLVSLDLKLHIEQMREQVQNLE